MPTHTPWRCECCGHYRAGTPEEVLDYYRDESGGPDACWPFTGPVVLTEYRSDVQRDGGPHRSEPADS